MRRRKGNEPEDSPTGPWVNFRKTRGLKAKSALKRYNSHKVEPQRLRAVAGKVPCAREIERESQRADPTGLIFFYFSRLKICPDR